MRSLSFILFLVSTSFLQGARGNMTVRQSSAVVKNTITIADLNLTLFPTPQLFPQDKVATLEGTLSSFVISQLIPFYNQTSYQLIDASISIVKTLSLKTTSHCRYLKIDTARSNLRSIYTSHRLTQEALWGATFILSGHMVFQDDPVPDLDSAQTEFLSAMSQLTLLLEYLKQGSMSELQNITYVALSGQTISYQNDYSYNCSFSNNSPQTDGAYSRNAVVIGSTLGAITMVIGLSSLLFLWQRSKTSRRKRMRRKVFRIKHLSDEDYDDDSLVPSSSSDQITTSAFSSLDSRYTSPYENGQALDNKTKQQKGHIDGEDMRSDSIVSPPSDIGGVHGYFFKPIEAFNHPASDDVDYAKSNTPVFPLHFDDTPPSSLSAVRAVSPPPSIFEVGIDRKLQTSKGSSKSTIKGLEMNTHIGAFPSRIPVGSFLKTPHPYADTMTLGSDNASINPSLTSGSTQIHPLDWSCKGSVHDGQSIDNTTMSDKEMFIIHRQNTPSILESLEEAGEYGHGKKTIDGIQEVGLQAKSGPFFASESAGSKQFVNDLVWLKQKISDIGEPSHDDNSSYGSASHSSDE